MDLVVIGPNLLDQSKGTFHVHKAGCRDLQRGEYRWVPSHERVINKFATLRALVEYFYGPEAGSFYEEHWGDEEIPEDAWKDYTDEFYLFPCCRNLPNG